MVGVCYWFKGEDMNERIKKLERQATETVKAENARELGLDYEPSKTIIEMAREVHAVFDVMAMGRHNGILFTSKELEAFAELVRADEREACERAIEELLPDADRGDCAAAIRARGQA
jgi:hypothetical protein